MKFELINTNDKARLGKLTFDRGEVNTPAFMPVGTYGAVKAMTVEEVKELGAEIILGILFIYLLPHRQKSLRLMETFMTL